jgi:NADPH2:quinone reductase
MRGVLVTEWTEFENLTLTDNCPIPELGPRHVRIKTQAAGVSFATSLMVAGKYQRKPLLPFVPGSEVAGYVTEVGPEADGFAVGDRVTAVVDWGGQAEEATAHAVNTFKIPDNLEFHRAVGFTNSYSTSYAALCWPHLLRVTEGDTVLIHGAAGGVGIAAIEISKVKGATVIATVGSEEKRAVALEHGADHVINYREGEFRKPVLELTNGLGANVIYDPVGGDVFTESLRCIAPEGRIMPVGFAGGTIQQIPANLLLVKNITVCGLNYGYYMGWSPTDVREQYGPRMQESMDQLFQWYEQGHLKPRVSHIYPLEKFQDAMATVLGREAMGRVVLVLDKEAKRLGL